MKAHSYDLFISYAAEDRAWVEGYLLDSLEAAGVRVYTEEAFRLGAPRLLEFERAVKSSARTLLVLTPAYLAENFAQFVDLLAQSYGLETATWPVIPLLLEPVELPTRLAMLTTLDATDPDEWDVAVARLLRTFEQPLPEAPPLPECPYPGMLPFAEADSALFYGREGEVQEMLERLRLHPFLTIIGPSGSGKSSLVYAGLLPALRQSSLFGKGDWQIESMRPGEKPFSTLRNVLAGLPVMPGKAQAGERVKTLLIVDQFEETYTSSGDEALEFQDALRKLTQIPNLYLVLTVRADFYTDLMSSPLWKLIQDHRLEVTPLGKEGLRNAIIQPAEKSGVFIESALVERLLADAAGEPGVLPLVQETLVLLWEKIERRFLPVRAYASLVLPRQEYGEIPKTGLQVAIARRADAVIQSLPEGCRQIARRIFLRLIQFGEGRADTRRQQTVDQLRSESDNPEQFEEALRDLAASRLVTLSGEEAAAGDGALRRVDISHEALITGWPMLQEWIDDRREAEQTRRRLENKAAEWIRLGQGKGGLMDEVEYQEAERWLQTPDAIDLGQSAALVAFVRTSRGVIHAEKRQQEAAQRRELEQAQALAKEQSQRAEEQSRASRRFRSIAIGLVAVVVVAVALAVMAFLSRQQLITTQGDLESAETRTSNQISTADAAGTEAAVQQAAADFAQRDADAAGTQAVVQKETADAAGTEAAIAGEDAVQQQTAAAVAQEEAAEAQSIAETAQVSENAALEEARNQKETAEAERDAADAARLAAEDARVEANANADLAAINQANAENLADKILDLSPGSMRGLLFTYYNNFLQFLESQNDVTGVGALDFNFASWTGLGFDDNFRRYAISREYGSGTVLAVGHERIISDIEHAKDFLEIAFIYLNGKSSVQTVLISTGHCERVLDPSLESQLREWGYQVIYIPSPINDAELSKGNILIIANAWGAFEESEINSVERFVDEGGGLFVGGFGYDWQNVGHFASENDCLAADLEQDVDLLRYPMNLLLAPYEMKWTPDLIDIPVG